MKFERIIEGKDHLWAVRDMNKPNNELAALFQKWNDAEYLWDFFLENQNDLQEFFHIERISEAVEDTIDDAEQLERLILEIPYTENLDELFIPLSSTDMTIGSWRGKRPGTGTAQDTQAGFESMPSDLKRMCSS